MPWDQNYPPIPPVGGGWGASHPGVPIGIGSGPPWRSLVPGFGLPFNSAGQLAIVTKQIQFSHATFSSVGQLSIATMAKQFAALDMAGLGNLTINSLANQFTEVNLSGDGGLKILVLQGGAVGVYLGSDGELVIDTMAIKDAQLALSGDGTLSINASVLVQIAQALILSGAGNLSISALVRLAQTLTLSGMGSLSIASFARSFAALGLSSDGQLSIVAAAKLGFPYTFPFILAAAGPPEVNMNLSGSGQLSIVASVYVSGNPTYDNVGAGVSVSNSASLTHLHTAVNGSYVFALTGTYETNIPTAINYGSMPMSKLGIANGAQYGWSSLWGVQGVSGGQQTVATQLSTGASMTVNTVSFTGVNSVATPTTVGGSSNPASQAVAIGGGKLIVQGFGYEYVPSSKAPQVCTGGINVYNMTTRSTNYSGLTISYANADTTFGTTPAPGYPWTGIAAVMS